MNKILTMLCMVISSVILIFSGEKSLALIFSISIIIFYSIRLAKNGNKKIAYILIGIFLIRICLLILDSTVIDLPGADKDSVRFLRKAYNYADVSILDMLKNEPISTYTYSKIASIYFKIFGNYVFIPIIVQIIMSIETLIIIKKISIFIGMPIKKIELLIGILALSPMSMLYSVLFLREVYIVYFFVASLYSILRYRKNKKNKKIVLAIVYIFVASIFHGGMAIVLVPYGYIYINSLGGGKIKKIILFIFLGIGICYYFNNFNGKISIDNLDTFIVDNKSLQEKLGARTSYSYGFDIKTIFNFMFAPFIYQVRGIQDLIACIDGIFSFYIIVKIIFNYKSMNTNSERILVLIYIILWITFSFGTLNYGTAFRHRQKFNFIIYMLYLKNICNRGIKYVVI